MKTNEKMNFNELLAYKAELDAKRDLQKDLIHTLSNQCDTFKQNYNTTKNFNGDFAPTIALFVSKSKQLAHNYLNNPENTTVFMKFLSENKQRFEEEKQTLIEIILREALTNDTGIRKPFLEDHIGLSLFYSRIKFMVIRTS